MTQIAQSKSEEIFRKYAWDYFSVHAAQRLTAFQFYISLSTALLGGYLVLIVNQDVHRMAAVVGILMCFLSFIFYKLDQRTRQLIKNAERAICYLDAAHNLPNDGTGSPNQLCLMAIDNYMRGGIPRRSHQYSYTRCFNLVFSAFCVIGVAASSYALYAGQPPADLKAVKQESAVSEYK